MSTRPQISPITVINAGSMAGNLTSAVTLIPKISMMSYGCSWSGTSPVGTIAVQVSNDYSINAEGAVNNAGTWTPLYFNVAGTPSNTLAVSGNTGTAFIDIDQLGAYAIRLVYTAGSGTGTLTVTFNGKVS